MVLGTVGGRFKCSAASSENPYVTRFQHWKVSIKRADSRKLMSWLEYTHQAQYESCVVLDQSSNSRRERRMQSWWLFEICSLSVRSQTRVNSDQYVLFGILRSRGASYMDSTLRSDGNPFPLLVYCLLLIWYWIFSAENTYKRCFGAVFIRDGGTF